MTELGGLCGERHSPRTATQQLDQREEVDVARVNLEAVNESGWRRPQWHDNKDEQHEDRVGRGGP
jgi:hypothetical protein